jgi:3-deoxy-D-manno-octulosonic-acid transferase
VAKSLLAAAHERWPDRCFLLTVSTTTAFKLAQSAPPAEPVTWFPFDHRAVVRRFFEETNPAMLVLVETELWPNVIREAARREVPVAVVNGRLSDTHFPRLKNMGAMASALAQRISVAAVQSDHYGDRFRDLGVAPDRVHTTGNIKFDSVATEVPSEKQEDIRQAWSIAEGDPLLVFGSTRPGEEALAARCWERLREDFPRLRLVVAPRHSTRAEEAAACFAEPVTRRSALAKGQPVDDSRILILDTVGELVSFYGLAAAAVIGGSFYPGVNGHNPIESAALSVPTIFGPHMNNFGEAAALLAASGGARQVQSADELASALATLFRDDEDRRAMGQRAREVVSTQRGATQRTLDLLEGLLRD